MNNLPLSLVCLLVALISVSSTNAQFNFGNLFQQQTHQRAQEQEAPPLASASWFHARVEAATCTSYLCPHTLSCVPSPSHCPCPMPQQIRCSYPDTSDPKSKDPMGLGGSFCVQEGSCDRINDMRHWATERDFKLSEFKALI